VSANLDQVVRRWFVRVSAVAAALLAVNVAVYFFGVARLGVLAAKEGKAAHSEGAALADMEAKARAAGAQVSIYREGQKALDTLAKDHLKTRSERLPEVQRTLEGLVRSAGMTSEGFRYSYGTFPGKDAKEHWPREYVEVQFDFRVSGSYPQLKKFLGDLQASPNFFLVDPPAMSVSGQGAVLLTMNVLARTYFVAGEGPALAAPAAAPGGRQP